jgi:hypothetical protein
MQPERRELWPRKNCHPPGSSNRGQRRMRFTVPIYMISKANGCISTHTNTNRRLAGLSGIPRSRDNFRTGAHENTCKNQLFTYKTAIGIKSHPLASYRKHSLNESNFAIKGTLHKMIENQVRAGQ